MTATGSRAGGFEDLGRHSIAAGLEPGAVPVCALTDLRPGTGAAALIDGHQIALIRSSRGDTVYALSNFDPFSRAFVLSRGIVGDRGGVPKLTSPMFKQSFDLETGVCLDDPSVRLPTFPTSVVDGVVYVRPVRAS